MRFVYQMISTSSEKQQFPKISYFQVFAKLAFALERLATRRDLIILITFKNKK